MIETDFEIYVTFLRMLFIHVRIHDKFTNPLGDTKKFRNFDNLSKDDAMMVFKDLLKDMGVTTSWKWEDANRVV